MVLSYTFKELGQTAMSNGDLWLVPVAVRSSKLREVRGGWSGMLATFLRRSFARLQSDGRSLVKPRGIN